MYTRLRRETLTCQLPSIGTDIDEISNWRGCGHTGAGTTLMKGRGLLGRLSTPAAWAIISSVAAATAVVAAGSLVLGIESWRPLRLGSASPISWFIGDEPWGAPWDAAAQPAATPVLEAVTGFTETLAWLAALGVLICVLSLVLHGLGWTLSIWSGLVVRTALGARWRHLVGLLGRRWVVLAGVGVLGGLAAGVMLTAWLRSGWPELLGARRSMMEIVGAGLTAGAVSLLILAVVGLPAPLLLSRKRRLTGELQGDRATTGGRILIAQNLLAVAQFAGLLVVAFAGFLLWRDAPRRLSAADSTSGELNVTILTAPPESTVAAAGRAAALHEFWTTQRATGGDSVALTNPGAWLGLGPLVPVTAFCEACFRGVFFTPVTMETVRVMAVSPESLAVMSGEVLRGRDLSGSDRWGAERVVLLNETAAYQLFPGADPLGRTVYLGRRPSGKGHTVTGVVRRTPPRGPGNIGPVPPTVFVSVFQHPPPTTHLVASPDRPLAGLAMPSFLVEDGGPLSARLQTFTAPVRFFARLFLAVAMVVTIVAGGALVAVMVQVVVVRRRELAVRLAVGARNRHIFDWVLRRALRITGVGVLLGVSGARVIWEVLYPARSGEGVFFPLIVMTAAFAALAVVSSLLPVRRAVRVDAAELWSG